MNEPPELAHSWPFWLLAVGFPVFVLAVVKVLPDWTGYVVWIVPFAMCPVRDWMLTRFWSVAQCEGVA